MATQKKIDTVKDLEQKLEKAQALVLADYRGIKHKQLEDLRRELKKTGGELAVTKNRLLARALGEEKASLLAESLEQPTALLLSYEDIVGPVKTLIQFFKEAGAGTTKAGLLGDKVMTEKDITALSKLPSREVLLGSLAGQLMAPLSGLHYAMSWNIRKLGYALNAIKEKKTT